MNVNDWSSVDCASLHGPSEKDQKFLVWLLECVKNEQDLLYQVALLTLRGLDVVTIAEEIGCMRRTVVRKQVMVTVLRVEYDADYWWI
ncbi:MAG: hypothetical protein Q7R63_00370 [bacterium]|nr:hypothetical protein [bacterium]